MLDGVLDMVPGAKGAWWASTANVGNPQSVKYYVKLASDIKERMALILEPMLATGGTLDATIDLLKQAGCTQYTRHLPGGRARGIKRIQDNTPDLTTTAPAWTNA
jgi:uracil phosphoribosyltransferase